MPSPLPPSSRRSRLLRGQDSSSLLFHCALREQDEWNACPVPERLRASPHRLPETNPLPHSLLLRTYYFKAGWPLTLAESSTGPTVPSPTQHQVPPLHLQANEELRVVRCLTLRHGVTRATTTAGGKQEVLPKRSYQSMPPHNCMH